MRLIIIPPYNNPAVNMGYVISELLDRLKKRSRFDGDEIDIDKGYPTDDLRARPEYA